MYLEINIDRDSGVPIYVQLKQQIKMMIKKGILSKGERLPPERELSKKLKISRNRVSTAYQELENDGILLSQQGKGTFVAGKIEGVREPSRKDKLLKIIDLAMEEAIELGFSLDDFLTIAYVRAKEKQEMLSKLKVAFIECNKEQLSGLIRETELDNNIASIPILIDELREEPERINKIINKVEFIITTSFHLQEVEEFVSGMDKEVIAMNLEPKMKTIVKIARIQDDSEVGLICKSENFALEVQSSLKKVGLDNFSIEYTLNREEKMTAFVEEKDILITSPHCYKDVKKKVGDTKEVIIFDYIPDKGSVNMVNMALLDLKAV